MILKKTSFFSLIIVAVFSPWGDLARFIEGRGITSLAAFLLIFIGVYSGNFIWTLNRYTRAVAFFCFLVLAGLASFLAIEANSGTYMSILLALYCILALSVGALQLPSKKIIAILSTFAVSAALMSIVSLVDYYNVIDIQLVNRISASRGLGVSNLVGPFASQTPMAAHLCLAFPVPITFLCLQSTGWRSKIFWGLILLPILYAGVLTYSRGLFLSFFTVIGYLSFLTKRVHGNASFIRFVLSGLVCLFAALFAFKAYAPAQYQAFMFRLNETSPEAIQESRSDVARLQSINSTIEGLRESPFGIGFTRTEYQVGARVYNKGSHSNVVELLRAGGLLGFLLVSIFLFPIISRAFRCQNYVTEGSVFACLASFFAYGLTHLTLATLFAWILAGVVIGWECQKRMLNRLS